MERKRERESERGREMVRVSQARCMGWTERKAGLIESLVTSAREANGIEHPIRVLPKRAERDREQILVHNQEVRMWPSSDVVLAAWERKSERKKKKREGEKRRGLVSWRARGVSRLHRRRSSRGGEATMFLRTSLFLSLAFFLAIRLSLSLFFSFHFSRFHTLSSLHTLPFPHSRHLRLVQAGPKQDRDARASGHLGAPPGGEPTNLSALHSRALILFSSSCSVKFSNNSTKFSKLRTTFPNWT